jgi:hypothetical protein
MPGESSDKCREKHQIDPDKENPKSRVVLKDAEFVHRLENANGEGLFGVEETGECFPIGVWQSRELAKECPLEALDVWQKRSSQSSLLRAETEGKKREVK